MKAERTVIASNGVPYLQIRSVGSHNTAAREKERKGKKRKEKKKRKRKERGKEKKKRKEKKG